MNKGSTIGFIKNMGLILRIFAWSFMICAAIAFLLNLSLFILGESATGTVTKVEKETNRSRRGINVTFSNQISFLTEANTNIVFTDNAQFNPSRFELGEKVPVKYFNSYPYYAHVDSPMNLFIIPGMFAFAGGVFYLIIVFSKL